MDEKTKIILDFVKRMGLERQKKLMELKKIKIGKRQLSNEERTCRKSILHIEAKIRSEVLANPTLKKQFKVMDEQSDEEADGAEDKGF